MPEEYELAFSSRPGAMAGPQDPTTQEEVAVDMPRANGTSEAVQPLTGAGGERGPRTAMGGDGERGARLSPALERCFWLSVCSIIFGCSCVGIYALVNAVRARESYKRGRVEEATNCRKKAVKFSAISFVTYILSIALVLGLIVLVSYLVRLAH